MKWNKKISLAIMAAMISVIAVMATTASAASTAAGKTCTDPLVPTRPTANGWVKITPGKSLKVKGKACGQEAGPVVVFVVFATSEGRYHYAGFAPIVNGKYKATIEKIGLPGDKGKWTLYEGRTTNGCNDMVDSMARQNDDWSIAPLELPPGCNPVDGPTVRTVNLYS